MQLEELSKLYKWAEALHIWVTDCSHLIYNALKPFVDWVNSINGSKTPLLDKCSKKERKLAYARHARWKKKQ